MFLEAVKALRGAPYNRCSVITHIREILILIAAWLRTLRPMPDLHNRPCAGSPLLLAGPRLTMAASGFALLQGNCCNNIFF